MRTTKTDNVIKTTRRPRIPYPTPFPPAPCPPTPLISHQYQCIYVHQRKTAGTAIINSFGLTLKDPDWQTYNEGVLDPGYATMSEAVSWYFKFTTVRNPFDRLVSSWKYLAATRNRSLEDVLLHPPAEGHDYRHLTRPQTAILLNADGEPVVDFMIRYEALQEGYDQVCDMIGKPRMTLSVVNATTRDRDYRTYFNAVTRRLAEEHFKDDLAAFGYEF